MADWLKASFLHASPKIPLVFSLPLLAEIQDYCLFSWATELNLTLPGSKASQCLLWEAAEPSCHISLQMYKAGPGDLPLAEQSLRHVAFSKNKLSSPIVATWDNMPTGS